MFIMLHLPIKCQFLYHKLLCGHCWFVHALLTFHPAYKDSCWANCLLIFTLWAYVHGILYCELWHLMKPWSSSQSDVGAWKQDFLRDLLNSSCVLLFYLFFSLEGKWLQPTSVPYFLKEMRRILLCCHYYCFSFYVGVNLFYTFLCRGSAFSFSFWAYIGNKYGSSANILDYVLGVYIIFIRSLDNSQI